MLRVLNSFMFILLAQCLCTQAMAMDGTDVLPQGIRNPSIRQGYVSGVDEKFNTSGKLMNLGELNSSEFTASTLKSVNADAAKLVDALNSFGNYDLGDKLNLGVLHVNTKPEVDYKAMIFAYGLTNKVTLAVGLPAIHYTNKMSLSESGGNVNEIAQQYANVGSSDLKDAFKQLSTLSLVAKANEQLAEKGYAPINNRDQTYWGDLQIATLYKFYDVEKTSAMLKTQLTLPTGPKPNPDDLADLGIFGRTALDFQLIGNYKVFNWVRLAAKAGHKEPIPDKITARVPTSDDDTLPDASTRQTVDRKLGSTEMIGGATDFMLNDFLTFSVGYERERKYSDHYSGPGSGRYDLLEVDTNSESQVYRLGLTFDTINSYFKNAFFMPLIASYEYSDTFAGINTERETVNEFWLQIFF